MTIDYLHVGPSSSMVIENIYYSIISILQWSLCILLHAQNLLNDTQLYLCFYPIDQSVSNTSSTKIEGCVNIVKKWLVAYDLKTECIMIGSEQQKSKILIPKIWMLMEDR